MNNVYKNAGLPGNRTLGFLGSVVQTGAPSLNGPPWERFYSLHLALSKAL